jgi:serine/threonine-protein kinase
VHRDLKPSNVFVTKDEEGRALVKVLDFGIAKLRASLRKIPVDAVPAVKGTAKHATMHGFLLGTPAFMSPEQAKGKTNVDHRADVWALGVIAYHLLTAHYPFDGASFDELMERLCRVRHTSILKHRPDLPDIVADFFARAFSMRIDQRFQSATAFANAFEQLEPLAKVALSLPPPPPKTTDSDPVVDPGTMVAAGLPAKNSLLWKVGGGVLVAAVLAATGGLLKINFEREPAVQAAKLTAGANITSANISHGSTANRDVVPGPDDVKVAPGAPPVAAHDLPAAPQTRVPAAGAAPASVPAYPPISASLPEPQPAAPAPKAAPSKVVNKSEVF